MTQPVSEAQWPAPRQSHRPDHSDILFGTAILMNAPVAIWKLPGARKTAAVVDLSGTPERTTVNFSNMPSGFVFAPFGPGPTFLIKESLSLRDGRVTFNNDLAVSQHRLDSHNMNKFDAVFHEVVQNSGNNGARSNALDSGRNGLRWYISREAHSSLPAASREVFCRWVDRAKYQIADKGLLKVVLARSVEIALPEHFDPLALFKQLCHAYPNAFVALVAIPGVGTWIGATPELLLNVSPDQLTTVSLAGTQKCSKKADLSSVTWNEKELDEQQIVSDYIEQCFMNAGLHSFEKQGPVTVQAGNLLHLKTQFILHLRPESIHSEATRLLQELHPTPAVGGAPKQQALEFIRSHEICDREFYSGFLGPVNMKNRSHLFVNLRCMQLKTKSAKLYAGSGITLESDPEKEWFETELKLNTLLKFFGTASSDAQLPSRSLSPEALCDESL
ncbi:MAG: chorismate-binding protein [bacterium]